MRAGVLVACAAVVGCSFTDLGSLSEGSDPPDAASYPSTPILDDFNRADGPLGLPWVGASSPMYNGSFSIGDHELHYNQGGMECGDAFSIWGSAFGATQEVFATLRSLPDYGRLELRAKVDEAQMTWVSVQYDVSLRTIRVLAEPSSADFGTETVELHNGDRLGARFEPDGRVVVFVNAAVVSTRMTNAVSAGGWIGLAAACAGTAGGASLDDFGGGDVPP